MTPLDLLSKGRIGEAVLTGWWKFIGLCSSIWECLLNLACWDRLSWRRFCSPPRPCPLNQSSASNLRWKRRPETANLRWRGSAWTLFIVMIWQYFNKTKGLLHSSVYFLSDYIKWSVTAIVSSWIISENSQWLHTLLHSISNSRDLPEVSGISQHRQDIWSQAG